MSCPEDNSDVNKMLNSLSIFVEIISLYTELMVKRFGFMFKRFMENFEVDELFDSVGNKLAENKPLRLIVCLSALSCAIPVVLFVLFGITSLVITFTGFLFIEGTLLAMGGLLMFVCTATMILVLSVLAVTSVGLYLASLRLSFTLSRLSMSSNMMRSIAPTFIQREGRDGADKIRSIGAGDGN